jgi:hypothetical protein
LCSSLETKVCRAGGGHQAALRCQLAHVLQQRRHFGVAAAVVQLQQRHVAARVDLAVIAAVVEAPAGEVHLHELGGEAGFAQRDVDGLRAGGGRVIQLHGRAPVVGGEPRM